MTLYLSAMLNRFTSPTPPFFRKVRNVAAVIAAASGAILLYHQTDPTLPAWLVQAATVVGAAATAVVGVAQSAKASE